MVNPLDATAGAALMRAGECSPQELVTSALARIDAGNPALNAVIHRRDDQALAEASLADGSFRGVPIVVKDSGCSSAGEPATFGMRVLRAVDHRSPSDSALTRRLRGAGFVIVGRTNVPELRTAGTTEPLAFGPTHNPWDLTRSPGGSSGGSAAAVAAGFVAVAHGSDGGGSVRLPAACCR
jgi:amidase